MAYMRGDYYIWSDAEDRIHLWIKDGYDHWDACYEAEDGARLAGYENASGVSLPEEVMDEFVVMRLAELIANGTVGAAIDRAIDPNGRGGNFGGMILQENGETLKRILSQIELNMPKPS